MHSCKGMSQKRCIQILLGEVLAMPISPMLSTRQPSWAQASASSVPTLTARSNSSSVMAGS